ncbi:hypothetical protein BJ741DRAFT_649720 [Chytriomyces cf. hyalinus JEL632]|nr:hypothetical protein BJ741DRAFT_649720 [Chytriomyces cf. hyalinus JEL632]
MAMRFDRKADLTWYKAYTNTSSDECSRRLEATLTTTAASHHVYKCIQEKMFATPRVNLHPLYKEIQPRFKQSEFTILELGCCYGTDARFMLSDGLQEHQLTVSDLVDPYFRIGNTVLYEGCSNLERMNAVFGDLAVPVSEGDVVTVNGWESRFSAVSAQAILHVLSEKQVKDFLGQIHRVLKGDGVLFGSCVGSLGGGAKPWGVIPTKGLDRDVGAVPSRILHDCDSLRALLDSVGFVDVKVELDAWTGCQDIETKINDAVRYHTHRTRTAQEALHSSHSIRDTEQMDPENVFPPSRPAASQAAVHNFKYQHTRSNFTQRITHGHYALRPILIALSNKIGNGNAVRLLSMPHFIARAETLGSDALDALIVSVGVKCAVALLSKDFFCERSETLVPLAKMLSNKFGPESATVLLSINSFLLDVLLEKVGVERAVALLSRDTVCIHIDAVLPALDVLLEKVGPDSAVKLLTTNSFCAHVKSLLPVLERLSRKLKKESAVKLLSNDSFCAHIDALLPVLDSLLKSVGVRSAVSLLSSDGFCCNSATLMPVLKQLEKKVGKQNAVALLSSNSFSTRADTLLPVLRALCKQLGLNPTMQLLLNDSFCVRAEGLMPRIPQVLSILGVDGVKRVFMNSGLVGLDDVEWSELMAFIRTADVKHSIVHVASTDLAVKCRKVGWVKCLELYLGTHSGGTVRRNLNFNVLVTQCLEEGKGKGQSGYRQ